MKLIPTAFIPDMILAIYKGWKTQTRRLNGLDEINVHPDNWTFDGINNVGARMRKKAPLINDYTNIPLRYEPGDVLWAKETYYQYGHWQRAGKTKKGNKKYRFVADSEEICYDNNKPSSFFISRPKTEYKIPHWYKRNSRFMPLVFARLFLEIKSVGVERLQSITREDAAAEGVCIPADYKKPVYIQKHRYPEENFATLWDLLHGATDMNWQHNPWVIKLEFTRTKKPPLFYEKILNTK